MRGNERMTVLPENAYPHAMTVFVDFDGTITQKDIGANIFLEFGTRPDVERIVDDIRELRINAMQGWERLFQAAPGLSLEKIESFVRAFEIDHTFHAFVQYCEQAGIPVFILSDGFDNYIDIVLRREGLERLKYFSNSLIPVLGKVVPHFPHTDGDCTRCANCKRNHILNNSGDEEYTVYIGNGSSDTCPAQYCDFIFAKDDLRKYCERERISYSPYRTFDDVVFKLKEIAEKKNPRKRHQAYLKRLEVYKAG